MIRLIMEIQKRNKELKHDTVKTIKAIHKKFFDVRRGNQENEVTFKNAYKPVLEPVHKFYQLYANQHHQYRLNKNQHQPQFPLLNNIHRQQWNQDPLHLQRIYSLKMNNFAIHMKMIM